MNIIDYNNDVLKWTKNAGTTNILSSTDVLDNLSQNLVQRMGSSIKHLKCPYFYTIDHYILLSIYWPLTSVHFTCKEKKNEVENKLVLTGLWPLVIYCFSFYLPKFDILEAEPAFYTWIINYELRKCNID